MMLMAVAHTCAVTLIGLRSRWRGAEDADALTATVKVWKTRATWAAMDPHARTDMTGTVTRYTQRSRKKRLAYVTASRSAMPCEDEGRSARGSRVAAGESARTHKDDGRDRYEHEEHVHEPKLALTKEQSLLPPARIGGILDPHGAREGG